MNHPIPHGAARERVYAIWQHLAHFDVSRTDDALAYGLAALGALVDAQDAAWCAAVRVMDFSPRRSRDGFSESRDPWRGWRICAWRSAHPSPSHARRDTAVVEARLPALLDDEGVVRVTRWRDGAARRGARGSRTPRSSAGDSLVALCPVNADLAAGWVWHRAGSRARFTRADRDRLAFALSSLGWFHRRLCVGRGLSLADAPFTAAQHAELRRLLRDRRDAETARRHASAAAAAHAAAALAKLGLRSRAELVSLWDEPLSYALP